MNEPKIIINKHHLTNAQVTTIRVAIESFATTLEENGLGDDDIGKNMVKIYKQIINEIRYLMLEGKEKKALP